MGVVHLEDGVFEAKFCGYSLKAADGTCWEITDLISRKKYQHQYAPFEATEVHSCVCKEDPHGKYLDVKDAVVKIKYQVYGNASAIQELGDIKIKLQRELQESPESEVTTRNLDRVNQLIYAAKHPVDTWNVTTQNEVYALNQFTNGKSAYTPHLLDVIVREVWEDLDVVGMVKGYIVFTIMTKLPGKRLRHAIWRCWPLEKRDKIRAPFKEAILDVWSYGIRPEDNGMRNIIWDEEREKCYIVDFEDVTPRRPEWDDSHIACWDLSEECIEVFHR